MGNRLRSLGDCDTRIYKMVVKLICKILKQIRMNIILRMRSDDFRSNCAIGILSY